MLRRDEVVQIDSVYNIYTTHWSCRDFGLRAFEDRPVSMQHEIQFKKREHTREPVVGKISPVSGE